MPICRKCRIGIEPDERCPSCGCPAGSWDHLRFKPTGSNGGSSLLKAVMLVPIILVHCFASAVASCLYAGVIWSSPSPVVEIPIFLGALTLLAPAFVLMLLFDLEGAGVGVLILNSLIWVGLAWLLWRTWDSLRLRRARNQGSSAASH